MLRTRATTVAVISAAALLLSGCHSANAGDPTTALADGAASVQYEVAAEPGGVASCVEEGDTVLSLGETPLPTEALTFGDGASAVILAHQAGQRPCAWVTFGRALADQGYRVFIPALVGTPESVMGAAVAWLSDNGVDRYALVGASMGGTFSLAAAPGLSPAPSLIVALSSPAVYGESDAVAAIADLDIPVLIAVGDRDGEFAQDAQALADAQPGAELMVVESAAHGILLRDSNADVAARVDAALAKALG